MNNECDCRTCRSSLWELHANELPAAEADALRLHLTECRECELHSLEAKSLSAGIRHLPRMSVSPLLATRLRVIASKQRARELYRHDFAGRMRESLLRLRLQFDNLLRPIAVPATGGLLASFFCFASIVGALHLDRRELWDYDIPIGFQSEIAIDELSPFSFGAGDVMVQLSVDSKGQVTDFSTPAGSASHEQMQAIGNLVLYSTFTPAFRLGRPVASKRLFYIGHISIKG